MWNGERKEKKKKKYIVYSNAKENFERAITGINKCFDDIFEEVPSCI